jgi:hypothetical protein
MTKTFNNRKRRGVALIGAISFTIVVLGLGLGVTSMATYERKSTQTAADTIVGRNIAEAGADMALWKLKQDPTWRCTGNPADFTNKVLSETVAGQTVTLGRYTVKPITTNADGTISVATDGIGNGLTNGVSGKTKTIGMTAYQCAGGTAPFAYALLGGNSVKINNSIVTDSYSSATGVWTAGTAKQNGGVATLSAVAGAMWNTNNPTIKGKVIVGAGAVSPPSTSYWASWSQPNVLGGFTTFNTTTLVPPVLPAVTAPGGGTAFGSAYNASPTGLGVYIQFNSPAFGNTMDNARSHDPLNNNYSWVINGPTAAGSALILNLTAINLTNQNSVTINGNVILVVSGNVSTTGATNFYINGSLMIYVGGTVSLANSFNNTAQRPKDFAIIGLPSCTSILFSGNVPVCGYVYAPTATFTTSGSGDISGSIVANNVVMGGNAKIHYDESLGGITMGGGTGLFKTKTWQEDG